MPIPSDFPREPVITSLSGAQPKVAVRFDIESQTYVESPSDEATQERFDICEDLVNQLVAKCRTNRCTKYSHLSEAQILERLLAQLLGTSWGSPAEMTWVIRETGIQLGWAMPLGTNIIFT